MTGFRARRGALRRALLGGVPALPEREHVRQPRAAAPEAAARREEDLDYAAATPGPEGAALRIPDEKPAPHAPIGERRGIPDYDIFFRQPGGDNVHGTADDPARYANERILDYRYALVETRGPESAGPTHVLGPWLPKNIIIASALGIDRAHPLRGRIPATAIPSGFDGTAGGIYDDPARGALLRGRPAGGGLQRGASSRVSRSIRSRRSARSRRRCSRPIP